MTEFVVGLDLAVRTDYTALVIIELRGESPRRYVIKHTERWRGLEYHEIIHQVRDRLQRPPLGPGLLSQALAAVTHQPPNPNRVELIVDESGVGIAVVDTLRGADLGHPLTGVMITGGTATTRQSATRWHVSKAALVSVVDALLDQGRLTIGRHVPGREQLIAELQAFRRKFSKAANEQFSAARESDHDDLVLATALACWAGEQGPARPAHIWFLDQGAGEATREIPLNEIGGALWR